MSKNYLAHIAERVINEPLLILPSKLEIIGHVLEGRIGLDMSEFKPKDEQVEDAPKPHGSRYVGDFAPVDEANPRAGRKPYRTTAEGVAIIPVHGSLVNRGGFLDALSGLTSYEKLKYQIEAAANDGAVKSILLDIDSPGGEAVGAFETSDAVRRASLKKEIVAVANGLCCSAAYAIASGATKIIASRSSLVGSIGTVMLHLDRSKQLADAGIRPTLITAGARKADGNPYEPLSDEVKGELKSYINRVNANFIQTVAEHRGVAPEKILALQAGVYIGAESLEHGLADEVGTFEAALDYLQRGPKGRNTKQKGASLMTDQTALQAGTFSQAQLDSAVSAARAESHTAGVAEGTKAGAAAERARFAAVHNHETHKGREGAAFQMLSNTDMTADAISGVLATLPAGTAAASAEPKAPEGRSKDAANGLALVDTGGANKDQPGGANLSDFEKGREIAKSLKKG